MNWKNKKPSCGKQRRLQNKLYGKAYLNLTEMSSLKIQIGELLLYLNESDKPNWRRFETILRQYIDLKVVEMAIEKDEKTASKWIDKQVEKLK